MRVCPPDVTPHARRPVPAEPSAPTGSRTIERLGEPKPMHIGGWLRTPGNPTPKDRFARHWIVLHSTTYYDPSYGREFATDADHEAATCAGFDATPTSARVHRKNTSAREMLYTRDQSKE